jgi:transposase
MHFITTYSTYFAQELAATPLDRFEIADTAENRRYIEQDRKEECLLVFRTKGEFWGKERTVLVTHAPASARKQAYTFADKMEAMRQELLAMRAKVRDKAPQWRNEEAIRERYVRYCEQIHMDSKLYDLEFSQTPEGLLLSFRKNVYLVGRKQAMFGKNIIITDNTDWLTGDIIEASLARWQVEDRFRLSKDDDLVGTSPVRHWTDSKIRCHLLTCVVAMTYLRRIELRMAVAGKNRSIEEIMNDMRLLHHVLSVKKGSRAPERRLETPSKTQSEVLSAFGYHVDESGVLQGPAS